MKRGNYILWLPSWYPNRIAPLTGDFIQRHARAVATHVSIEVVFLIRDAQGTITKDVYVEERNSGDLKETIVYYYIDGALPPLIQKIKSFITYRRLFRSVVNKIATTKGLPLLSHVHVALKAGVLALWLKKRYHIPYLLSEHWSGYLPEAKPGVEDLPFASKLLLKKLVRHASGVSAVSCYLKDQIEKRFGKRNFRIIPNIVDAQVFIPKKESRSDTPLCFLHISTLDFPKNPEAIIEGFSIYKKEAGVPFILRIVGPENKKLKSLATALDLEKEVIFMKEMEQVQLVPLIHESDALVLFSRYETFGCVLIEANACGLPVIVSDVPTFKEHVQHGLNGLVAKGKNAHALAGVLHEFFDKRKSFNPERIRAITLNRFAGEIASRKFIDWYKEYVNIEAG